MNCQVTQKMLGYWSVIGEQKDSAGNIKRVVVCAPFNHHHEAAEMMKFIKERDEESEAEG